jgi:phosphoglycolate phosphatase
MVKLVIFDLDGTLINSVKDLAIATNFALVKLGLPTHETDAYRFMVGNGVNKLLVRALPEHLKDEKTLQKMRELMIPYYAEHCTDNTVAYPNIENLLKRICEKGIKIAVASNKVQSATEDMIRHYFPDIKFVATFGQRDGYPVKPDPIIVEDILKITDVKKEQVLYVGDTAVDIQTAKNAGIKVAAVTWGFRPLSELQAQIPDYIVDNVDELQKIIFNQIT